MRGFEFRLRRLSNVREVQEQQAREVWAAAERAAQLGDERVQGVRELIAKASDEQRELQSRKQIPTSEVMVGQQLLDDLHHALQRAEEQARMLREQAEQMRVPWQERRAELQGLERLEERASDEFRVEQQREDAKQMDQIAMERNARPDGDGQAQRKQ